MLPAVKAMVGLMNKDDTEMINMFDSVELFINHLDELIGVFDSSYEGGDFCAGLTFGYSGSNLLFKIAEEIITRNIMPTPTNSNNTKSSIENTHQ